MLLGLVLAFMTLAVLATVLAPLLRSTRPAPERGLYDRAVYRDQLKEVERDVQRGVLSAEQARTARLEIERRLLASGSAAEAAAPETDPSPLVAGGVAILVVAVAAGLYLRLGAPGVPDEPYASRGSERALAAAGKGASHSDFQKSAAKLEQELKQTPGDVEKWLLLARTEAALQDWQKSAEAYGRALGLAPDRDGIASSYGEMLVFAAQGIVTPAARDAFKKAVEHDPKDMPARFYLALGEAQAGNSQAAIDGWQQLAAETPEDAPVRAELQRRIEETAKQAGIPAPALAAPAKVAAAPRGPSAEQMQQAAQMSPQDREAMIRGMVGNLAQRLEANPNDPEGWLRLARAYTVLKEPEKAADAFDHAARLKPDDTGILVSEVQAMLAGKKPQDTIPEQAVALLHRIEAKQPDQPAALWYLGLAEAQARHPEAASAYWRRLLPQLPPDSNEHKLVTEALGAVEGK